MKRKYSLNNKADFERTHTIHAPGEVSDIDANSYLVEVSIVDTEHGRLTMPGFTEMHDMIEVVDYLTKHGIHVSGGSSLFVEGQALEVYYNILTGKIEKSSCGDLWLEIMLNLGAAGFHYFVAEALDDRERHASVSEGIEPIDSFEVIDSKLLESIRIHTEKFISDTAQFIKGEEDMSTNEFPKPTIVKMGAGGPYTVIDLTDSSIMDQVMLYILPLAAKGILLVNNSIYLPESAVLKYLDMDLDDDSSEEDIIFMGIMDTLALTCFTFDLKGALEVVNGYDGGYFNQAVARMKTPELTDNVFDEQSITHIRHRVESRVGMDPLRILPHESFELDMAGSKLIIVSVFNRYARTSLGKLSLMAEPAVYLQPLAQDTGSDEECLAANTVYPFNLEEASLSTVVYSADRLSIRCMEDTAIISTTEDTIVPNKGIVTNYPITVLGEPSKIIQGQFTSDTGLPMMSYFEYLHHIGDIPCDNGGTGIAIHAEMAIELISDSGNKHGVYCREGALSNKMTFLEIVSEDECTDSLRRMVREAHESDGSLSDEFREYHQSLTRMEMLYLGPDGEISDLSEGTFEQLATALLRIEIDPFI